MSKSSAAIQAQLRRDKETDAREALKMLIPEEYFTSELTGNRKFNLSTKVFVATKEYLQHLEQQIQRSQVHENPMGNAIVEDKLEVPFCIPNTSFTLDPTTEYVRQLRQVATRLVQKVEERLQAGDGWSPEFQDVIGSASDLMIDTIAMVEKTP